MKRFTAVLAVLCVALSAFSCSGDGTAVSVQGTSPQNTTESIKTESTTSGTEVTGKPEFTHPAIEEINESIEKTLTLECVFADISSEFFVRDSMSTHAEHTMYQQLALAERENGAAEKFIIQSRTFSFNDKTVYFDGSEYYVSYLGVNAKIPQSGVSSVTPPRELIAAAISKFPSDENVDNLSIDIRDSFTIYSYTLRESERTEMFGTLLSSLEKTIGGRTEKDFRLTAERIHVNICVNADGLLGSYDTVLDLKLTLDGVEPRSVNINASVSVAFLTAEGGLTPPEGTEACTPLESEAEIPLILLQNATDKTGESKILRSSDTMTVSKRELDGSITPISISSTKVSSGTEMRENFTSRNILGSLAMWSGSAIFTGDAYYVLENRRTSISSGITATKVKYSPEDFERIFGYRDMYKPHTFSKSEITFAPSFTPVESDDHLAIVDFTVSEKEFLAAFGEQAAKAARAVAGEYEIWQYNVANCAVSASITKDGYIDSYNISFDLEVSVTINDKKFAFKAEVTDVLSISHEKQSEAIYHPGDLEGYTEYTPEKTD